MFNNLNKPNIEDVNLTFLVDHIAVGKLDSPMCVYKARDFKEQTTVYVACVSLKF